MLTRRRNADDDRHAPALVRRLQGSAHRVDVANALKGVVHATIGHIHDHLLDGTGVFGRINTVGCAQLTGHFKLVFVEVNGNDSGGFGHHSTLDHAQSNPTAAKHSHS